MNPQSPSADPARVARALSTLDALEHLHARFKAQAQEPPSFADFGSEAICQRIYNVLDRLENPPAVAETAEQFFLDLLEAQAEYDEFTFPLVALFKAQLEWVQDEYPDSQEETAPLAEAFA